MWGVSIVLNLSPKLQFRETEVLGVIRVILVNKVL